MKNYKKVFYIEIIICFALIFCITTPCYSAFSVKSSKSTIKPSQVQGKRKNKGHGTYDEIWNRNLPYTFFVPNNDITSYINGLRIEIRSDSIKSLLLKYVCTHYNTSYGSFAKDAAYGQSLKAKMAAFIYLIGLKYNFSTNTVDTLPAFGSSGREEYAIAATNILNGISTKGSNFNGIDRQRFRAFELINYLHAFDYIKTAKEKLQSGASMQSESNIKSKLLDFTTELHSAANNIFQSYGRNNNISIIVASAVGMSAVIFANEGAGRLQFQQQPERWGHAAHSYISRTMFEGDAFTNIVGAGPMSSKNGPYTYGEGSHYFTYCFQALFPFMKTYYKCTGIGSLTDNSDPGGRKYNPCKLCSKVGTTSYNSNSFTEIYKWYVNSLDIKGKHATVDDSWTQSNVFGQLLDLEDNRFTPFLTDFDKIRDIGPANNFGFLGDGVLSFEPDILLSNFSNNFNGQSRISNSPGVCVSLKDSNIYINVNSERDVSINGDYHEHGDVGSFEIRAGKLNLVQMVFDPPYFGEANREWVNNGFQHNSILVDGDGPHKKDQAVSSDFVENLVRNNPDGTASSYSTLSVKYNYWNHLSQINMQTAVTRKMSVFNDYSPYIIIEDDITNNSASNNDISFRMNGNGYYDNGSFYFRDNDESAIWSKPCSLSTSVNNYRMRLRTSLVNADGSVSESLSFTKSWTNIGDDGPISLVTSEPKSLAAGKRMKLISTIELIPCNDTAGQMTRSAFTPKSIFFRAIPKPGTLNYHGFTYVDSVGTDTIHDINGSDSSQKIVYKAEAFHVGYDLNPNLSFGSCSMFTNFRFYQLINGSRLTFNDTVLVDCDESVTMFIKMTGYNRYVVKAITTTDTTRLKLYLFGLDGGMTLTADGAYTYSQDSTYMTLTLLPGTHEIRIEPDPCLASCYFPPTLDEIVSLFDFKDGSYQFLGHKLDIESPNGILAISNGSKIEISCNKYLRNKDSLILSGGCGDNVDIQPCDGPGSKFKVSPVPGILISSGSALVLDSGSHTIVGNNSCIVVRAGASLIIKDSAVVEIGGGDCGGYGLILAEPGSYVYIQPGAKISFHKVIGDTVDKHKFLISNFPSYLAANPGVSSLILPLLADDTILTNPISPSAVPFCDLKNSMNPVIANNEWGFANFLPARVDIRLRNDTLCPGELMVVDLRRILNDNRFWFEVCRMDSVYKPGPNGLPGIWMDTCIIDTMPFDSVNPDPGCMPPHIAPDWFIYKFQDKSVHRVTFEVANDCGEETDTVFYVTMTEEPEATVFINDSTCPGFGSAYMVVQTDFTGDFSIELNEIENSLYQTLPQNPKPPLYRMDTTGIVPDTIFFDSIYFKGGRDYLVTLQLTNDCGNYLFEDTISIPFGVDIRMEKPTLYANPVHGARQVQLHGYISDADSFRWVPDTWLDRSDSLVVVSTPLDAISYTLNVYSGACSSSDTIFIKYNHVANSGVDDTVCYTNSKVLVGNAYDLSVFLGFLYYKNPSSFKDLYTDKTYTDNGYFYYFSLFMQSQSFKDWAQSCGSLYSDFTEDLAREQTIRSPWFIDYFEQLVQFDDPEMVALDNFVYNIDNDSVLQYNYQHTGDWGMYGGCMTDFFTTYDDFVISHVNEIAISWLKVVGGDTSFNGSLQESSIAIDEPAQTTLYIQQVITPDYAEFDETLVIVDTIPEVEFVAQFQIDSTVVLQNLTNPFGSATFEWDFGDGTPTSSEVHPVHTFPIFDTSFVVCLAVSNDCGVYNWCDTIYIDSGHWGGGLLSRNEGDISMNVIVNTTSDIQSAFYPNPTNGSGTLYYKIYDPFESGEVIILDPYGKSVFQAKFNRPMDSIKIPFENHDNGMYFYVIRTNTGQTVNGKIIKF
jgi:hypothetical protein